MLRYALNLTMHGQDRPFLERFAMARELGFTAVEFLFPYGEPAAEVDRARREAAQEVVLFNLPAGRWDQGERGIAILPDRRQEFREGVELALDYARRLGTRQLNCLAGIRPPDLPMAEAQALYVDALRYAADQAEAAGCLILVEAINPLDVPGFLVTTQAQAAEVVRQVDRPNCRLQFDVYHAQRSGGELLGTFRALFPLIAHVQIADNPGRHQPGTGEIHFPNLLAAMDAAGYTGYVGLEYVPLPNTAQSLGWLPYPWRAARPHG